MNATQINEITEKIIGCAYIVGNALGCGFLEKVYENALAIEIAKTGLRIEQQHGVNVGSTPDTWLANSRLTCWSRDVSSWN